MTPFNYLNGQPKMAMGTKQQCMTRAENVRCGPLFNHCALRELPRQLYQSWPEAVFLVALADPAAGKGCYPVARFGKPNPAREMICQDSPHPQSHQTPFALPFIRRPPPPISLSPPTHISTHDPHHAWHRLHLWGAHLRMGYLRC